METTSTPTTTTAVAKATGWANQTPGEKAFSLSVFGASTVLSVLFAYYLFSEPARLGEVWLGVRALPLVVQLLVWLLCLPWMIALWIWVSPLAWLVRLVLVISVLVFTEYLMWPFK